MKKLITLFAAVLMAVGANAENKVFKITVNTASSNPWDAQCFINLKNVEKGKANVVKMKVKTSVADAFKIQLNILADFFYNLDTSRSLVPTLIVKLHLQGFFSLCVSTNSHKNGCK